MEAKCNITVGKDGTGEFMQHQLEIGDTKTNITRAYYKIVDEQLIKNMPLDILEDMVAKGTTELYSRAENNSTKHKWLGKALNSLLNGIK